MPGIIVVGTQWGDEGKGKVVDACTSQANLVVRFQGGANAGHTLLVADKKTVLHLIPSGILHENSTCIIGPGVVLDIEIIVEEIEKLKNANLLKRNEQLLISDACTVVLSYHKAIDAAREQSLGKIKIGTTGKGIGPAYEDRASRNAILFADLFNPATLELKLERALREKNFLLESFYKTTTIDIHELKQKALNLAEKLAPYRCTDTGLIIHKALKAGKKVLFEGAQGTMLDILHGTYPFVTSSSTIAGSACVGSGVSPTQINTVIGIMKAYTTRVGAGPFPSELNNEAGEKIQQDGHEFGSTTGRKRRCGWIDLVALKYSLRINGITNLALMKLDVLSGHKQIGVCVDYKLDGKIIDSFPLAPGDLERVEPVYEMIPGWDESIVGVKSLKELPINAQRYISFLENQLKTPIDVISVGPGREQTLWVKPLFA